MNPEMSRSEMAKALNLTEGQIRTATNKLKERKIIHREGSDTEGKWIID
jgi:predicted HTH transcriptional regulator